jgi:hypothetical protein
LGATGAGEERGVTATLRTVAAFPKLQLSQAAGTSNSTANIIGPFTFIALLTPRLRHNFIGHNTTYTRLRTQED